METKQRIFPPLPQYENLDFNTLLNQIQHNSPQVRASALAALGGKMLDRSADYIVEAIKDERNRKTPWFGFITIAWVGIVVLLENGDKATHEIAKQLVNEWDEDERKHFISWLKDYPDYVQALN